jgi:hypothetical protein
VLIIADRIRHGHPHTGHEPELFRAITPGRLDATRADATESVAINTSQPSLFKKFAGREATPSL